MKTQQAAVYAAEHQMSNGKQFVDITEAQDYADALLEHAWWPERVKRVELLKVTSGMSRAELQGNVGVVALRVDQLNERVLLHEVSHILAETLHTSKGHDPWFCREHLNLVYRTRGADVYTTLRDAYVTFSVDYMAEVRS